MWSPPAWVSLAPSLSMFVAPHLRSTPHGNRSGWNEKSGRWHHESKRGSCTRCGLNNRPGAHTGNRRKRGQWDQSQPRHETVCRRSVPTNPAPIPDIAVHVVESERIRFQLAHRVCSANGVHDEPTGLNQVCVVTTSPVLRGRSRAAGKLPFRLGGQAVAGATQPCHPTVSPSHRRGSGTA